MNKKPAQSLDDIRNAIETYAKKVANLKDQKGKGLDILRLRSNIEEGLSFYRAKGAHLDPEETRLGNFDSLLERQSGLLVKIIGKRDFVREREGTNPPHDHWWWWLDIQFDKKRKKNLQKIILNISVFIVSMFLVYFLFLRLPPQEKLYLDLNASIEKKIEELALETNQEIISSEYDRILQECDQAISLFPERPAPYLIKGIIQDKLNRKTEAQENFAFARSIYSNQEDYLLERAMWYFRFKMYSEAKNSLFTVLELNPNSISAMNLLGTIYEEENNIVEALKAYFKVLELAEEQDQPNIIPVVKMKVAMLQMRLPMSIPEK